MIDFTSQMSHMVKHIVMASPNGVLMLQPVFKADIGKLDLVLTDVNAVACQKLGCPLKQVLGKPFHLFFPQLGNKKTIEHCWQVVSTGKPIRFLLDEPASGSLSHEAVEVSVIPLFPTILVIYEPGRLNALSNKHESNESNCPC